MKPRKPKREPVGDGGARMKRPVLERTAPIRSWTVLAGLGPRPSGDGKKNGQPGTETTGSGTVQRGVELGYQVVDEYLKHGQVFAGMVARPSSPREMGPFPQLTERMFRYASDFASIWQEAMGTMVANVQTAGSRDTSFTNMRPPNTAPPPSYPRAKPPDAAPTVVSIEIDSPCRTKASIDLKHAIAAGQAVVVQPLHARSGRSRIRGVKVQQDPAGPRITISVRVPKGQPAGTYSGDLIDADSKLPLGTVTVQVSS